MNRDNQSIIQDRGAGAIQEFMARIYGWMTVGLLLTAFVALYTSTNESLVFAIFTNKVFFWGIGIAQFGCVIVISALMNRITAQVATAFFMLYSVLTGLFLSIIFLFFTKVSIVSTLFVTAGTFAGISIYGYTTKRDLSKFGSFFIMGLFGLIIATCVNLFLKSPAVYWVTTYLGVLIFIGLTVYDTNKLKAMGEALEESNCDSETYRKYAIFGALSLYLDFINLFIRLLYILGDRR